MALLLNQKIKVAPSSIEGKGLFATQPFQQAETFHITSGEHPSVIMSETAFEDYNQTVDSWDAVYIGNGEYRVSILSREDDPSNYGNHSCDPNIAPQDDGVTALRDIAAGEEITIDYSQFSAKAWSMSCNCGVENCQGIVRGKL